MIFIRDGTRVYQILMLLACVGEFPAEAIQLLGNERTWKRLIRQLSKFQDLAFLEGTHRLRAQVLTVSGKGKRRTIRLHKSILPILELVKPAAYDYYIDNAPDLVKASEVIQEAETEAVSADEVA